MSGAPSQSDQIADRLLQGKRLTSLDAMNDPDLRCMRLAGRVDDLKKRGMPIRREMIKLAGGKRVARYFIAAADLAAMKASER